MADKNFEQNVHDQMEGFKLSPSAQVWQQVNEQLQKDKRKRRRFFIWLPIIALVAGGGSYMAAFQNSKDVSSTANTIVTGSNDTKPATAAAIPAHELIPEQPAEQSAQTKEEKQQQKISAEPQQVTNINNEPQPQQILTTQQRLQTKQPSATNVNSKQPLVVAENRNQQQVLISNAKEKLNRKQKPVMNQKVQSNNSTDDVAAAITVDKKQADAIAKTEAVEKTKAKTEITATAESLKPGEQKIADQQNFVAKNIDSATVAAGNEKAPASAPVIKKGKSKWQIGWQLNAGVADIGAVPLPFVSYKRENTVYSSSVIGSATGGTQNIISEFYNYDMKTNLQLGGGMLLRKKISKKILLVTGLQYQYSSFTFAEKLKRDSFSVTANTGFNLFDRTTKTNYKTHYIAVPTEVQWQLIKRKTNSFNITAGVQHLITISKKELDSVPRFLSQRSSLLSAPSVVQQPALSLYQPMLHFAPSYEWQRKKGSFSIGWYFNYGLRKVYSTGSSYHLRQTGITFRYYLPGK